MYARMLSKVYSRQDQDRSDDSHSQGPCVAMRNLSQLRDYNYQLRQEELPPARNSNQKLHSYWSCKQSHTRRFVVRILVIQEDIFLQRSMKRKKR